MADQWQCIRQRTAGKGIQKTKNSPETWGKFANSYRGNDRLKGTLISENFVIERPYINFLIAGGNHPGTRIELAVEGTVVHKMSGKNTDALVPGTWAVLGHIGKTAQIRIVDEHAGGWGHIDVDHIVFSHTPRSADTVLLPASRENRELGQRKQTGSSQIDPVDRSRFPIRHR